MAPERTIRVGHISDVHYTKGQVWEPQAWEQGVERLNAMDLDAVIISGDLTNYGLRSEWEGILPKLDDIHAPKITCLGNHDARREGWRVYEEVTGRHRYYHERIGGVDFIVLDSSEPDLDDGHIGREQRAWLEERLAEAAFPVVVLHHHLVPIPNTGREMNILRDAGGTLRVLDEWNVPLVVGGHRHMPWAWRLNDTLIAHAGTFSSNKRQMSHSFNRITLSPDAVRVELVEFPSDRATTIVEAPISTRWGGPAEDIIAQVHRAGV